MKIKDLPKVERPREKLMKYGPEKLNNIELLAIILGSGKKGVNVIELSKKIIKQFSEQKLPNIKLSELSRISGIGKTKACRLIACFELGKRFLQNKQSALIMCPKDAWNDLKDIRASKKEYFVVFYLDIRNQIIKREIISIGSLNASLVHPREVFEPAIKNNTAQIILSHNHPSGDSHPSDDDLRLTTRLIKAGEILGIEIIDHVIVTEKKYFSMKENKII